MINRMRHLPGVLDEDSGPGTWEMARRFMPYLKPFRGRLIWGLALGAMGAIFNLVMLLGFRLIFSLVLQGQDTRLGEDIDLPIVGVVNMASIFGLEEDRPVGLVGVMIACGVIPLLIFFRGFLGYLGAYCITWVGKKVLFTVRSDLFRKIQSQSLSFFNQARAGELMQTVFNQASVAQVNAVQLITVLSNRPLAILSILIYLFADEAIFTLLSLVILPLCIAPVVLIGKRVRKAGAREEREAGAMLVSMQESFSGARLVKAYGREDFETKRFDRANAEITRNTLKWNRAVELVGPVVEAVASLGIAAGLVYAWKTGITADQFIILVVALMQIYPPAKELSRVQLNLQKAKVASKTVLALLDKEPEIQDNSNAVVLPRPEGRISFDGVSFHYKDPHGQPLEKAAVTNVSLDLSPGGFYALVGPSGSGKSTLFSLLLRFYEVDQGAIRIDGKGLRDVTQNSLRSNIGMVSQDTFLFHDTIRENIRYGRLDATEDEIIEAAKKAHAHEFITEIQGGYDAIVGDSGANLSGGQKQRISIARAILKNAPILLLDEATSALDTESERIIQDAIHTLSEGKTVIAIAHRLSTVLEADQIIVMKQGHVEAQGKHADLLTSSPLYQKLYQLQFQDSEPSS